MAAFKVLSLLALTSLAFCVAFPTAMAARSLSEAQRIPASIEVPQNHHHYKVHQTLHARGYQYYKFNGTSWVQFNATARLYNSEKKQVGHHFYLAEVDAKGGQPTWESVPSNGVSFSIVTCKAVSKVGVDKDSIPWVLLQRTQSKGSSKYFGEVAFVQRINTKLGLPPSCTKGASVGDIQKSPYTSDYLFYVSQHQ